MITSARVAEARAVPFVRETSPEGSSRAYNSNRLRFLERLAAKGDMNGFHVGPMTMILCNNIDYVQSILVEHSYEYFSKSQMARRFTSRDGLFVSEGEAHRKRRKVMAPMFQPRHIAHYVDEIVECGVQVAQSWSDGLVVDINQQMVDLTRRVILKVLFGLDQGKRADDLIGAIMTGFRASARVARTRKPPTTWSAAYAQQVQKAKGFLETSILQMIEERRAQEPGTPARLDMLSVLVDTIDDEGKQMTDRQIIDECALLFTAGYETTMTALAWTWYFLCENPALYERIRQEVQQVLQDRPATASDLPRLALCLQAFKESMRLYPPVPFLTREALEDIVIDGYQIPKGASLLIAPYTIQRKTEYFPEPETFDLDRFSPENEKRLPRYAYFPFGAGPRICMGNHLVYMEAQLLLATLVQQVTFELKPGQTIKPDLVRNLSLRPHGKMIATVHRNR